MRPQRFRVRRDHRITGLLTGIAVLAILLAAPHAAAARATGSDHMAAAGPDDRWSGTYVGLPWLSLFTLDGGQRGLTYGPRLSGCVIGFAKITGGHDVR